jgi:hypothetical protein
MSDDKPRPLQDVRKGLGLLFRAAKAAVEKLPTRSVEDVVVTSAREVGRAIENVASTIERGVFGKKSGSSTSERDAKPAQHVSPANDEKPSEPKPPDAA